MVFMDVALAQRLERSEALGIADYPRLLKRFYPLLNPALEEIGGGYAVYTGRDFPINRAVGLGMQGAITAGELERVERFYHQRAMLSEIELCPLADPSLMGELGQRGYRVVRFFNIQVRELEMVEPALLAASPIEVTESHDEALWLQASTGRASKPDRPDISYILATLGFHRPGARCFVAWIDGAAVGSGAMVVRGGLAQFFSASTQPSFRRRGVQQALLDARLAAARSSGCDLAMVMTVPGNASQRNVQRAGFTIAYTKVVLQRGL